MSTTTAHLEHLFRQARHDSPSATVKLPTRRSLFSRTFAQLLRWRELSRQRRELGQISDATLHDIGLSRVDALREAGRPFWNDPTKRN